MFDDDAFLYRQVVPDWVQDGRPTSLNFRPTGDHENELSHHDGEKFSPEKAFKHSIEILMLKSAGVLGVEVGKYIEFKLKCIDAPEDFDGHVIVDFSELKTQEKKRVAKSLRDHAWTKGWLYRQE